MSQDFKNRLRQAYDDNLIWKCVENVCSGAIDDDECEAYSESDDAASDTPLAITKLLSPRFRHQPIAGLSFTVKDGMIYYHDKADGSERLCIPNSMTKEIFKQAYNDCYYQGFERTYYRVRSSFYIRRLARLLRTYIRHCPPMPAKLDPTTLSTRRLTTH
jgi:hypothetical protein